MPGYNGSRFFLRGDKVMQRLPWLAIFLALCMLFAEAGLAGAAHVPSMRTSGFRTSWPKSDVTVPYLTTGRSAFMPGAVAPFIYASPVVDDPNYRQTKPVFNLIFYGAVQAFGDRSNGAMPKPR